jgi:putative transposase
LSVASCGVGQVYSAAGGECREAWQRGNVSGGYYPQKAELAGINAALPAHAAGHSQVLQEVVQRVDRAFQAFCSRVARGETPGSLRFHGRDRANSRTSPPFGTGATRDKSLLKGLLVRTNKTVTIQPRSSRLICVLLLRRGTDAAARAHWTANRD